MKIRHPTYSPSPNIDTARLTLYHTATVTNP